MPEKSLDALRESLRPDFKGKSQKTMPVVASFEETPSNPDLVSLARSMSRISEELIRLRESLPMIQVKTDPDLISMITKLSEQHSAFKGDLARILEHLGYSDPSQD